MHEGAAARSDGGLADCLFPCIFSVSVLYWMGSRLPCVIQRGSSPAFFVLSPALEGGSFRLVGVSVGSPSTPCPFRKFAPLEGVSVRLPDLHISVQDYPSRIVHHLCRIVPLSIFLLRLLGLRCLVLSPAVSYCPLPPCSGRGSGCIVLGRA